ncbi:hypothetical protein [Indiicoccus explosivorum]|uniref:hypothetical protein n=1 Tax=Indiicoccus explosivorum TaxID=1917864 RepID=UPI000B448C1D|nr:hypothetical protein [Indiicoccus explosivorum]
MKKSILTFTAPALVVGLALAPSASADAPNANASAQAKAQVSANADKVKVNAGITNRIDAVEDRLVDVNAELELVANILADTETLTAEQAVLYQKTLDGLLNRVGASENQLNAVINKVGSDLPEVADASAFIATTTQEILEVQSLLDGIEITVDPELDEVIDETADPAEDVIEVIDDVTAE